MLTSKILPASEFLRFIEFNQKNNGSYVDVDYLHKALVRVFFDDNLPDEWIAAYVVNKTAPFRCLSVLTDEQRRAQLAHNQMTESQIAEITLLSRVRHVKWDTYERELYYNLGLIDVLRTGRQFIIGGTVEEKLVDIQMEIFSHLFYEGNFNFFGHAEFGWLFYASGDEILHNALHRLHRIVQNPMSRPQLANRSRKPNEPLGV